MKDLAEINNELWKLANEAENYTPDNMRIAIQDMCNDLDETTKVVDNILDAAQEVCECLLLENMARPSFTFHKIEKLNEVLNVES